MEAAFASIVSALAWGYGVGIAFVVLVLLVRRGGES